MLRRRTVQVPITARYFAAFVLLSFLCYGAHELTHHLAARVACGGWGSMTFSTFQLSQGCEPRGPVLLATLAGPLVTYLFMYGGVLLMMRGLVLPGFRRSGCRTRARGTSDSRGMSGSDADPSSSSWSVSAPRPLVERFRVAA